MARRAHYDEDAYAPVGTPFDPLETEEDVHKAKARKDKEHYVLDEQGRRRFHGAFTGGFSAGYYNTVGSKEGWTPSTFKSSRDSKTGFSGQKPEDFMDAEDLGTHGIAPRQVSTRPNFEQRNNDGGGGGGGARDGRVGGVKRSNDTQYTVIPGEAPLQNLIVPTRTSIGARLLRKMGWREGQGVGPRIQRPTPSEGKVYGCSLPNSSTNTTTLSVVTTATTNTVSVTTATDDLPAAAATDVREFAFAPREVNLRQYQGKDDLHGIGYRGMEERAVLGRREVKKAVHGMSGEAFGLGALEEDDDVEDNVYAEESMTSYDVTLAGEKDMQMERNFGWTGGVEDSWSLDSFTKCSKPSAKMKVYVAPDVPRDFVPIHRFSILNIQSSSGVTKPEKPVSVGERNRLLADTPGSVFSLLSAADRERLRKAAESTTAPVSTAQAQPTAPPITKPHPPAPPITSSAIAHVRVTEFPPGLYVPTPSSSTVQQHSSSFNSSSTLGDTTVDNLRPFASNPLKQARYDAFLSGRRCPSDRETIGMTEWERQKERDEFARMKRVYQPLSVSLSTRFTREAGQSEEKEKSPEPDSVQAAKADMFGALTREVVEWHPHPVLCKRFNIPDPYPNDGLVGTVTAKQKPPSSAPRTIQFLNIEKASTTSSSSKGGGQIPVGNPVIVTPPARPTSQVVHQQPAVQPPPPATLSRAKEETAEHLKDTTKVEEGEAEKDESRPPMDLFKAIFAESSSSESETEAQGEEEEEDTHPISVPKPQETTAATNINLRDKEEEPRRRRRRGWQDLAAVTNRPLSTVTDLNNTSSSGGSSGGCKMAGESRRHAAAAVIEKESVHNGTEKPPNEKLLFGPALPPGFDSGGGGGEGEEMEEREVIREEKSEEKEKRHKHTRHNHHHKSSSSSSSSKKEKRIKHDFSSDKDESHHHNHKKRKEKKKSKHKHHY